MICASSSVPDPQLRPSVYAVLRRFLLVGLFVIGPFTRGTTMQLVLATVFCIIYQLVQQGVNPYRNNADAFLAMACSFSLTILFITLIFYKFANLTDVRDLQAQMSYEQREDYIIPTALLTLILIVSVMSSLVISGLLMVLQVLEQRRQAFKQRRLRYVKTHEAVIVSEILDEEFDQLPGLSASKCYHLFLSHAWPLGQDVCKLIKQRLKEILPSASVFLDVDDLETGSGTKEVDHSRCVLVFALPVYFQKYNCAKEVRTTLPKPNLALQLRVAWCLPSQTLALPAIPPTALTYCGASCLLAAPSSCDAQQAHRHLPAGLREPWHVH